MSVVTRSVLGKGVTEEALNGRVAVVTGSSHGLGAGLAARFYELGLRVGMCGRKRPEPPPGSDPKRIATMSADVRDASDLEALTASVSQRFGRVDLWVNNAGVIDPIGKLADVDPGMIAHHVAVNFIGVANGSRTFARHVRTRPGGGVLVNITSGAANTVYCGWAVYCASKAAVDQLTAVVAEEEKEDGLRAYSLAPGLVDTDMQAKVRAASPKAFPAVEKFLEAKRNGTFNTPSWVADAILELAFGEVDVASGGVVRVPNEWDAKST
jgi:NAD(P)-dependent dehydrogenase (short-subunit alcohol dehydrogenase family)